MNRLPLYHTWHHVHLLQWVSCHSQPALCLVVEAAAAPATAYLVGCTGADYFHMQVGEFITLQLAAPCDQVCVRVWASTWLSKLLHLLACRVSSVCLYTGVCITLMLQHHLLLRALATMSPAVLLGITARPLVPLIRSISDTCCCWVGCNAAATWAKV